METKSKAEGKNTLRTETFGANIEPEKHRGRGGYTKNSKKQETRMRQTAKRTTTAQQSFRETNEKSST